MLKCLTMMRTSFLSNKVSANLIYVLSVNAIGCGKVGEMTHGVFYIVNNRGSTLDTGVVTKPENIVTGDFPVLAA